MQGLFYSVTATFTTLVLALTLFVVEHYNQFSATELNDAEQTKEQALFFLEAIKMDVENMESLNDAPTTDSSCRISMTREGRTRMFTFPTRIKRQGNDKPEIVQVTYELQGQAKLVNTRNGKRDLYKLRRYLDDGTMTEMQGGSSSQVVDFLVELIPHTPIDSPERRIVSGACPTTLDKVYVEFHLAINEVPTYVTVSRYSTTITRNRGQVMPANLKLQTESDWGYFGHLVFLADWRPGNINSHFHMRIFSMYVALFNRWILLNQMNPVLNYA